MPIARFQLEDGRVARFEVPEGTTPEQATSMMQEYFTSKNINNKPDPKDKSWIEENTTLPQIGARIKSAADEASRDMEGYQKRRRSGEISRPREILGGASAGASLFGAVTGEAVNAVGTGAAKVAEYIAPETFNKLKKAASTASDSELVKLGSAALKKGGEAWNWFEKNYPEASDIVKDTVNVALVAAPVKTSGSGPLIKSEMGMKLEKAAAKQVSDKNRKFIEQLVMPEQTKSVRKQQIIEGRSVQKGGISAPIEVVPSKNELGLADAVQSVDGISSKNTINKNINLVDDAISKEADSLMKTLSKYDNTVTIDQNDIRTIFDDANVALEDRLTLVEGVRDKIYIKAAKILASHPKTPSGLLASRKEFDSFIKSQGVDLYDESAKGSIAAVSRAVRKGMNDLLQNKVPNENVKASLQRQARLFDAAENMSGKAAMEGKNRFIRISNTLRELAPFKTDVANAATVATLGAGMTFAPAVVGTGVVLYVGGKAVASAKAKRILAPIVKGIDKAIETTTDPDKLMQLRADRLYIVNSINELQNDDSEGK